MERSGKNWSGKIIGTVPTQGEGTVLDRAWYYRQRHGSWCFAIAATIDDAVAVMRGEKEGDFVRHGGAEEFEQPEAAWPKVAAMLDAFVDPSSVKDVCEHGVPVPSCSKDCLIRWLYDRLGKAEKERDALRLHLTGFKPGMPKDMCLMCLVCHSTGDDNCPLFKKAAS